MHQDLLVQSADRLCAGVPSVRIQDLGVCHGIVISLSSDGEARVCRHGHGTDAPCRATAHYRPRAPLPVSTDPDRPRSNRRSFSEGRHVLLSANVHEAHARCTTESTHARCVDLVGIDKDQIKCPLVRVPC